MTNCVVKELDRLEKSIRENTMYLSEVLVDDKDLILASNSWENYRDSHCSSVSNIYLGGSMYNYALVQCKVYQSEIRVRALENDYKDTIDIITKGAP